MTNRFFGGANWLLSNGAEVSGKDGKKGHFNYFNRKNISSDSSFVFWTREETDLSMLSLLESNSDDQIKDLLESPFSGKHANNSLTANRFYGLTLSGAAARIAVRDWIEVSLDQVLLSLRDWFHDIAIFQRKGKVDQAGVTYPSIGLLCKACRRENDKNDQLAGRVGAVL